MPAYANTFPRVSISPGDSAQVWVTVDGNLTIAHRLAQHIPLGIRREEIVARQKCVRISFLHKGDLRGFDAGVLPLAFSFKLKGTNFKIADHIWREVVSVPTCAFPSGAGQRRRFSPGSRGIRGLRSHRCLVLIDRLAHRIS